MLIVTQLHHDKKLTFCLLVLKGAKGYNIYSLSCTSCMLFGSSGFNLGIKCNGHGQGRECSVHQATEFTVVVHDTVH